MKDYISLSKEEYEIVMKALVHAEAHCLKLAAAWSATLVVEAYWSERSDQYVKLQADLKAREAAE